jgi:putative RecB family exonuclease
VIALVKAPPAPPKRTETEVIEELQHTVSASRLGTFQRCRLQFYFKYVLELPTRSTPGLYVGKVIHAVLQALNLARWRGISVSDDDRKTIFDGVFNDAEEGLNVEWNGERDEQKALAWSALLTYFAQNPIPADEKPIGVEVAVEANLAKHGLPTVIGVIDLVRPNGRLVDYKTTSKTPNQSALDHLHQTQLSCYGILYRETMGKHETGYDLHHLVKLKKQPKLIITSIDAMTDQQQLRLFRIMDSYLNALDRSDFIPSPGIQCMSCEFLAQCKAWS